MNDRPSYPWSEGDALYASELNAAIANAGGVGASGGVSVSDYGAICDGVTNDTAAVNAALGSGAYRVTIPAGKCCHLPNGITVPSGVSLEGSSFFANSPGIAGGSSAMSPPSSSILTNANINSVTLGSGNNLQAVALRNIVVRTNAASAPTSGAGVYVNTGLHVRCENVLVYNAYDGFYWKAIATNGIIGWMDGCHTNQISGHHVVQDTWPELRLNMCRFTGNYGAVAYAYMTGGQSGNILPNGYFASNCHYNESGPGNVSTLLLIGGMVVGASASAQEFQFVNCHVEHANYAVRTDATETYLMKLKFIGCAVFSDVDFFQLNPATLFAAQILITGCDIGGPTFTMGSVNWQECQVVGNNINSNVTLNSSGGSTLAFVANGVVGSLTLAGAWSSLTVNASQRGGAFTNTATGSIRVAVPGLAMRMTGLPTNAAGLTTGDVWRNGTVLNIV